MSVFHIILILTKDSQRKTSPGLYSLLFLGSSVVKGPPALALQVNLILNVSEMNQNYG